MGEVSTADATNEQALFLLARSCALKLGMCLHLCEFRVNSLQMKGYFCGITWLLIFVYNKLKYMLDMLPEAH